MFKGENKFGEVPQPSKVDGKPYATVPDWEQIGTFGAGLAIGALIGAATALMLAPDSGEGTRKKLRNRFRRVGRDDSVWDELGVELRKAASRRKKGEIEEVEELEPV